MFSKEIVIMPRIFLFSKKMEGPWTTRPPGCVAPDRLKPAAHIKYVFIYHMKKFLDQTKVFKHFHIVKNKTVLWLSNILWTTLK